MTSLLVTKYRNTHNHWLRKSGARTVRAFAYISPHHPHSRCHCHVLDQCFHFSLFLWKILIFLPFFISKGWLRSMQTPHSFWSSSLSIDVDLVVCHLAFKSTQLANMKFITHSNDFFVFSIKWNEMKCDWHEYPAPILILFVLYIV